LGLHLRKKKDFNISVDTEKKIKQRPVEFIVNLIEEIAARLPSNIDLLENLSILSVEEALKYPTLKKPIINLAKQFYDDPNIITSIEEQWRNVALLQWNNTDNTEKFWQELNSFKDAGSRNNFAELCDLAKCALALPHSNAAVERVFSQMDFFKNKTRNRLNSKTTNALLFIKFGLLNANSCCDTYQLPEEVLRKIESNQTYLTGSDNLDTNDDIDDLDLGLICLDF
jgi:hypothetical protein